MSSADISPILAPEPSIAAGAVPRVWTVYCAYVVAIVSAVIAVGIASIVALVVLPGSPGMRADPHEIMRWLGESFIGVTLVILPGQAIFFAGALVPAVMSPVRWSERLALRVPVARPMSVVLLLLGSLGVLGLIEFLSPLLGQPSEDMKDFAQLLSATHGIEAVAVTLLVSVLPGVCEELLFRGYVQTRLVQRYGAPLGILIAAVLFALAHFDPQHVAAVLPIGVWLGTVAWLTRSTWVSMAAHAINNLTAVGSMHFLSDESQWPLTPAYVCATLVLLALGALGVMLARRSVCEPAFHAA